jgi:hypothetical protein
MKPEQPSTKAAFQWDDPLRFDDLLSDEERMIRDAARASFARRARKKARNAHARPRSSGSRGSQRVAARCPSSRTFARGSNST